MYWTYGKMLLILYILWGVGIISSQVFGHLGSFKGWMKYNLPFKSLGFFKCLFFFMLGLLCPPNQHLFDLNTV